jgi:hypothetical protein
MAPTDRVILARHFDVGAVDIDAPHRSPELSAVYLNIQVHTQCNRVMLSANEVKLYARLQLLLTVHDHLHAKGSGNLLRSSIPYRDAAGHLHHRRLDFQRI